MSDQQTESRTTSDTEAETSQDGADRQPAVSDPAEVIRLANMLQALLAEVRDIDLDEAGRARLFDIQRGAVAELEGLLSSDLESELHDLGLPVEDPDASEPELRLAQSQLVGWLNGLFQGIQATLMAQQRGSSRQLEQLQKLQRPELSESYGGGQYL